MKIAYFALTILGIFCTWYFNLQFMSEHGSDIRDFIAAATANGAAKSIAIDITIFGVAFHLWSFQEASALGMKHWWLYPVLSCIVAIAFAAPLFLLMRERKLDALRPASRAVD